MFQSKSDSTNEIPKQSETSSLSHSLSTSNTSPLDSDIHMTRLRGPGRLQTPLLSLIFNFLTKLFPFQLGHDEMS